MSFVSINLQLNIQNLSESGDTTLNSVPLANQVVRLKHGDVFVVGEDRQFRIELGINLKQFHISSMKVSCMIVLLYLAYKFLCCVCFAFRQFIFPMTHSRFF